MLVENKFIYVSLPRCASTSFMASCIKQHLTIKHVNYSLDIKNQMKNSKFNDVSEIDYEHFEKYFNHGHEHLNRLKDKFGHQYDIISVRRNKYERFISLWKHVLRKFDEYNNIDTVNKISNLTLHDILCYNINDLESDESMRKFINFFIKKHKLYLDQSGIEMFKILITPYSVWHNHDPDIIWFDFNELYKLEEWVSKKLDMDFKLIKMNSSNHFECNLVLNDEFKEKYDSIYLPYDEVKSIKTLF
jgi:hypothetical protein